MKNKLFVIIIAIVMGVIVWIWESTKTTFSVIIPVYNAEKYLSRCLDSIFAQSGSFEVIAVNDGSTDGSLQILQDYGKKYPSLRIISQKNQGVSAARNRGIKEAKNEYITFVDSDDWLEPNAFQKAKKILKKDEPVILLTGFYDVYDKEWVAQVRGKEAAEQIAKESRFADRNLDKLALFSPFYGKDAHSDLFYTGGGVRGRFFKKSFIDKYHIDFPEKISCHEDNIFLFRAFLHNPFISVMPEPVYNYRNRVDSISKSKNLIKNMPKSLAAMQNTPEYQSAGRRIQMLINDNWLSLIFVGIKNMQYHKIPQQPGIDAARQAVREFSVYNSEELKSCRYYLQLIKFLSMIKS